MYANLLTLGNNVLDLHILRMRHVTEHGEDNKTRVNACPGVDKRNDCPVPEI